MRRRKLLVAAIVAAAASAIPAPAGAVLSGENGRIVFVSGRANTDATALIYLLPVFDNTVGGGTVSAPIVPAGGQYRHPTWSPDRTKIAYANGDPATGIFDIYVQDIAAGTGPVQVTPTETPTNLSADRPAWSPDGTRLAYEHQPAAASADRQILVQSATDLQFPITTTPLTAAGAPFEGKPAWSPDSSTVYFHRGDPNTAVNADVYGKPAGGGAETLAVADSGISEFQPSISPDGTKMCFTLSNAGFNSTADVLVAPLTSPPSGGLVVSQNTMPAAGDYNCTWSPDGRMIAYVNGTFGTGRLVMVRADGTSPNPIELAQDAGANRFDGNPDWAPDGRPICPDSTVSTPVNTPVTIELECTDTGPAYERTDPNGFVANDGAPANGTTDDDMQTANPSTTRYTPNKDFTGTDSLEFTSFDDFGFGTDRGTVTINVVAPGDGGGGGGGATARCGGRPATVVGTAANDTLVGTAGADVIAGLGGNDTIRGGGGRDVICGGSGRDRIGGGSNNDRVAGGAGGDRVSGNGGRDSLKGGAGNDRLSGGSGRDSLSGGSGRDRLSGGSGGDRLKGGSGRDRLNGGTARDRCRGGTGLDLRASCELSSGIP